MLTLDKLESFTLQAANLAKKQENLKLFGKSGHVSLVVNNAIVNVVFLRLSFKDAPNKYATFTKDETEWEVTISYSDSPHIDTIYYMKEEALNKFLLALRFDSWAINHRN